MQAQRLANKGCDVKIIASNGSCHPAHSSILCSQSTVFQAMLQSGDFSEKTENLVKTNVKAQTIRNLLDAVYCQDIDPFGFHQACDLLQVALYYNFNHVVKIAVKFLVRCARHRCPDACCMLGNKFWLKMIFLKYEEMKH